MPETPAPLSDEGIAADLGARAKQRQPLTREHLELELINARGHVADLNALIKNGMAANKEERIARDELRVMNRDLRARIAELENERDSSLVDADRAHRQAGALHARVMELRTQVAARDARISELEAAQRPPLGYIVGDVKPDSRGNIPLYEDGAYGYLEDAQARVDEIAAGPYGFPTAVYELREVRRA